MKKVYNIIFARHGFIPSIVSFENREDAMTYFHRKALLETGKSEMTSPYRDLIEGDPNKNVNIYMEKFMEIKKDKKSFSIDFDDNDNWEEEAILRFVECELR